MASTAVLTMERSRSSPARNADSIRFYERLGARRAGADWHQYGFDEAALAALVAPSRAT